MALETSRPIALLSAIEQELTSIRSTMTESEESAMAGRFVATGLLDDIEVVVAEAGIGKVNTAMAVTLLVERFGCRLVVFTGVGGGLDPALQIGDVVVADRVIQHDTGLLGDEGIDAYQPGHLPFFNPTESSGYRPSSGLLDRVRSRLDGFTLPPLSEQAGGAGDAPRVVLGTILSGDQFVNSERQRKRLRTSFEGSVVEMEGGAVAQAAESLGVDHLVIRSVSDLAGAESAVDFSSFLTEVAANSVRVVRHLLPVL